MKFDLALVTTYLPILSLCSRATVLVCTLYLLRDLLLLASFELCSSIWNLRIKLSMFLKVLIVQCMAVTHITFACGSNSNYTIAEMLLRVILYYVITAVVILSGPYLVGADKTDVLGWAG